MIPNPTGNTNCAPLNRTTYQSSTGATYDIYCTSSLNSGEVGVLSGDLFFTYAPDFFSCLNGCAIWNTNASLPQCGGVSFDAQVYGPGGSTGGGWCIYRWAVHGPFYAEGWDSAQLKSIVRFLSVLLNFIRSHQQPHHLLAQLFKDHPQYFLAPQPLRR